MRELGTFHCSEFRVQGSGFRDLGREVEGGGSDPRVADKPRLRALEVVVPGRVRVPVSRIRLEASGIKL